MTSAVSRVIFPLILGLLTTACARPITIVGQVEESVDIDSVDIYYPHLPKCNFETVAYIRVEGGIYSLSGLIEHMRSQAADVGASAVYIMHTQRLDIKEYTGVAKAIRCEAT